MSTPHDRFVVIPAAYVLLLRRSEATGAREVLLQLREGTGYMDGHWAAAVAGHVEREESVYEAAAREAKEEIGVTGLGLTAICAMQRTGGTGDPIDERVDYFFTATSWSGEPQILEPDKCADLRWFALDALPDPVVPHELAVLGALRDGDVPPVLVHGF
ncbi:MAG: NUDIX domain-containing protein [Nocardioides sp.]